jgi:hypothetical protein
LPGSEFLLAAFPHPQPRPGSRPIQSQFLPARFEMQDGNPNLVNYELRDDT